MPDYDEIKISLTAQYAKMSFIGILPNASTFIETFETIIFIKILLDQ